MCSGFSIKTFSVSIDGNNSIKKELEKLIGLTKTVIIQ